jgi:hypothetical protein
LIKFGRKASQLSKIFWTEKARGSRKIIVKMTLGCCTFEK